MQQGDHKSLRLVSLIPDAPCAACGAYIMSQAGEGWECLPEIYDDGGWSGGNMDRPALKQLREDITKGRIDIVVVYKVDRLIPTCADHDPRAHFRRPMAMMRQG